MLQAQVSGMYGSIMIEFFNNCHFRDRTHHTCVIRCAIDDLDVVTMIVTNPATVETVTRVHTQVSNTLVCDAETQGIKFIDPHLNC